MSDIKLGEFLNTQIEGDMPNIELSDIGTIGAARLINFYSLLKQAWGPNAEVVSDNNYKKAIEAIKGKSNEELSPLVEFFSEELSGPERERAFGITPQVLDGITGKVTTAPAQSAPAPVSSAPSAPASTPAEAPKPAAGVTTKNKDERAQGNRNPLMNAVLDNNIAEVNKILATEEGKKQLAVKKTKDDGSTFWEATTDFRGDSALQIACARQGTSPEIIDALLGTDEGKAVAGTKNQDGKYPLATAAQQGNVHAINRLLATDEGKKTMDDQTEVASGLKLSPAASALYFKKTEAAEALFKGGATITEKDRESITKGLEAANKDPENNAGRIALLGALNKEIETRKAAGTTTGETSPPQTESQTSAPTPPPPVETAAERPAAPKPANMNGTETLILGPEHDAKSLTEVDSRGVRIVQAFNVAASKMTAPEVEALVTDRSKYTSFTGITARADQISEGSLKYLGKTKGTTLAIIEPDNKIFIRNKEEQWLKIEAGQASAVQEKELPEHIGKMAATVAEASKAAAATAAARVKAAPAADAPAAPLEPLEPLSANPFADYDLKKFISENGTINLDAINAARGDVISRLEKEAFKFDVNRNNQLDVEELKGAQAYMQQKGLPEVSPDQMGKALAEAPVTREQFRTKLNDGMTVVVDGLKSLDKDNNGLTMMEVMSAVPPEQMARIQQVMAAITTMAANPATTTGGPGVAGSPAPSTTGTAPTTGGTAPTTPATAPATGGTAPTAPATAPTTGGTAPTTPATAPTTGGTAPTAPATAPATGGTAPTAPAAPAVSGGGVANPEAPGSRSGGASAGGGQSYSGSTTRIGIGAQGPKTDAVRANMAAIGVPVSQQGSAMSGEEFGRLQAYDEQRQAWAKQNGKQLPRIIEPSSDGYPRINPKVLHDVVNEHRQPAEPQQQVAQGGRQGSHRATSAENHAKAEALVAKADRQGNNDGTVTPQELAKLSQSERGFLQSQGVDLNQQMSDGRRHGGADAHDKKPGLLTRIFDRNYDRGVGANGEVILSSRSDRRLQGSGEASERAINDQLDALRDSGVRVGDFDVSRKGAKQIGRDMAEFAALVREKAADGVISQKEQALINRELAELNQTAHRADSQPATYAGTQQNNKRKGLFD